MHSEKKHSKEGSNQVFNGGEQSGRLLRGNVEENTKGSESL